MRVLQGGRTKEKRHLEEKADEKHREKEEKAEKKGEEKRRGLSMCHCCSRASLNA